MNVIPTICLLQNKTTFGLHSRQFCSIWDVSFLRSGMLQYIIQPMSVIFLHCSHLSVNILNFGWMYCVQGNIIKFYWSDMGFSFFSLWLPICMQGNKIIMQARICVSVFGSHGEFWLDIYFHHVINLLGCLRDSQQMTKVFNHRRQVSSYRSDELATCYD
jgi:hypothetical protein